MAPSSPDSTAVVTDLALRIFSPSVPLYTCDFDPRIWHRIDKELYLHEAQQKAYLYVALANEDKLTAEDKVVTDIRISELPPPSNSTELWESRTCGIWVRISKFSDDVGQAVTGVDVLFGTDAVDPRPQWDLTQSSLQLDDQPGIPVARLSVRHGRAIRNIREALRVNKDGTFKILQISDAHMVTGVGICNDAIDAHGKNLPESQADSRTVDFINQIVAAEKPDLVMLPGDLLHHDIPDSQTALFKLLAPLIQHKIPYAMVFGNHDCEGDYALSREEQMAIIETLPYSLSEAGPEQVDGVGNFYLQVLSFDPSERPVLTLFFLDSHSGIGESSSKPDYKPIQPSQIVWYEKTSEALRHERVKDAKDDNFHLSFVVQHIPIPEFADKNLVIRSGHRREPTECPSRDFSFYDALVRQNASAIICGHDHVNNFCAQLQQWPQQDGTKIPSHLWLVHGGGSGFGGYCSYGQTRYYRQMRVFELNMRNKDLRTWMREEYKSHRVDELVLVQNGAAVDLSEDDERTSYITS
ncbi:hypothetical protein HBI95_159550 [Parastagonospora nodorum]|nr:hypothetical protein HBI95_159550 [Parastagonospora nodorum]